MHGGEPGIGAVLGQAEAILVAQKLAIPEDEGVALRQRPGGVGMNELGGHGGEQAKGSVRREERVAGRADPAGVADAGGQGTVFRGPRQGCRQE